MKQVDAMCYTTQKNDVTRVGGDLRALAWYSALKDYAKRFRRDKTGFIRVPSYIMAEDFCTNRTQVWRYNKMLEDKGLILLDHTHRGGRTWVGFRFI